MRDERVVCLFAHCVGRKMEEEERRRKRREMRRNEGVKGGEGKRKGRTSEGKRKEQKEGAEEV